MFASFDPNGVVGRLNRELIPLLYHSCGMLGVPGNIFLCTLWHGIHLRFAAGLSRSRCVGDDARLKWTIEQPVPSVLDKDYLLYLLSSLAPLSMDKTEIFDSDADPILQASRYIKRPFRRDSGLMTTLPSLTIPSFVDVDDYCDDFHVPSFSTKSKATRGYRRLIRFWDEYYSSDSVPFVDLDLTSQGLLKNHIFDYMLSRIHACAKEEREGSTSGIRWRRTDKFPFPPLVLLGTMTFAQWMCEELEFDEEVVVLERGYCRSELPRTIGEVVQSKSSKKWSFLVQMGYMRSNVCEVSVSRQSVGDDAMVEYLGFQYAFLYSFELVKEIPVFYYHLP
jgi:hypothetical protein